MAPDLNSLPSRSPSHSPHQPRAFPPTPMIDSSTPPVASPRSPSSSLAAAATINATDHSQHQPSGSPRVGRAHERRRSTMALNLTLHDPTLPSPGELASSDHRSSISMGSVFRTTSPLNIGGTPTIATGDPHHQRTPSLGEIHQELEQEQEAQVNRLLQQIRQQQAHLQQMQNAQQQQHSSPLASGNNSNPTTSQAHHPPSAFANAIDDSTPTSELSLSLPTSATASGLPHRQQVLNHSSESPSPAPQAIPFNSSSLQHFQDPSLTSVNSDLPSPTDIPGIHPSLVNRTIRDEAAFYQAETANLTRENQMLRLRIRELERMLPGAAHGNSHHGSLSHTTSASSTTTGEPEPFKIDQINR